MELSVWWQQEWTIPTAEGRGEAFSLAIIWSVLVIDPPFVVSSPTIFLDKSMGQEDVEDTFGVSVDV